MPKIGDMVTLPVKRKRRKKGDYPPPSPEKWVVVDVDGDDISVVRYSPMDNLTDYVSSNPLTWAVRRWWKLVLTGDTLESYRLRIEVAAENMRNCHDSELSELSGDSGDSRDSRDSEFVLSSTSSRYVDDSDLDGLIALAVGYFESQGFEPIYAGYISAIWRVYLFRDLDLVGSFLFEKMPNFDDPNQNSPWLGGYGDYYWRPDEELEGLLTDSQIRDLERLTQPLGDDLDDDFDDNLDDNLDDDFDDDLDDIDNYDRDPWNGKTSKGLGLFA